MSGRAMQFAAQGHVVRHARRAAERIGARYVIRVWIAPSRGRQGDQRVGGGCAAGSADERSPDPVAVRADDHRAAHRAIIRELRLPDDVEVPPAPSERGRLGGESQNGTPRKTLRKCSCWVRAESSRPALGKIHAHWRDCNLHHLLPAVLAALAALRLLSPLDLSGGRARHDAMARRPRYNRSKTRWRRRRGVPAVDWRHVSQKLVTCFIQACRAHLELGCEVNRAVLRRVEAVCTARVHCALISARDFITQICAAEQSRRSTDV